MKLILGYGFEMNRDKRPHVLITCPPLVNQKSKYEPMFTSKGFLTHWASVDQQIHESALLELLPRFDGWIMGDDPCTMKVLESGSRGALKAVVKWGVGTDSVDFNAISALNLKFSNTPGVFGEEVADLALGYLIALSRNIVGIHNEVREGNWPKPIGVSLRGKKVGIIGFGDIGKAINSRCRAFGLETVIYETNTRIKDFNQGENYSDWPLRLNELNYLILACSLSDLNRHIINEDTIGVMRDGIFIVNVSRGQLIDESSLLEALDSRKIGGAALDVFENEPLFDSNPLTKSPRVILGSHNGSNTYEAVERATIAAIRLMEEFLLDNSKP